MTCSYSFSLKSCRISANALPCITSSKAFLPRIQVLDFSSNFVPQNCLPNVVRHCRQQSHATIARLIPFMLTRFSIMYDLIFLSDTATPPKTNVFATSDRSVELLSLSFSLHRDPTDKHLTQNVPQNCLPNVVRHCRQQCHATIAPTGNGQCPKKLKALEQKWFEPKWRRKDIGYSDVGDTSMMDTRPWEETAQARN